MTEKLNIVQSTTEPDKRNIWLKDNELKKFGAKGWSTIGGSNTGGGGTSTDKEALYIYLDVVDNAIIVNNKKVFVSNLSNGSIKVNNKEIYDMLYNSLIDAGKSVFIKTLPNDIIYIFGYANYIYDSNTITLSVFNGNLSLELKFYNQ